MPERSPCSCSGNAALSDHPVRLPPRHRSRTTDHGTVEWFDPFLASFHEGAPPRCWASPAHSGSMHQCPAGSTARTLRLARPVQAARGARADELPARHRPRRGQGDGPVLWQHGEVDQSSCPERLRQPLGQRSGHPGSLTRPAPPQPLRVVSGLNTRAGWPQNRHSGPLSPRPSIHPTVLAVAACIPSNRSLMVRLLWPGGH
jgi:hypothetical protein